MNSSSARKVKVVILTVAISLCALMVYNQVTELDDDAMSEDVLIHAFETGRSLIIAKIISVHAKKKGNDNFYFYKAKVIQPVIFGDLLKKDLEAPLLFAGASYGDSLKIGSVYALFVTKDAPYFFSWAHRDNILKLDWKSGRQIQVFISKAKQIYANTSIRRFREAKDEGTVILPDISEQLKKACEQFRGKQTNRANLARIIIASDLGSRVDDSSLHSSSISYLPPKTRLSRQQALLLFGEPTIKLGYRYHWFCGSDSETTTDYVGILVATFDKSEKTRLLVYERDNQEKWLKIKCVLTPNETEPKEANRLQDR